MAGVTPEAAIAALVGLMKPPRRPTRPHTIDWDEFSRRNGFDAPLDYRLLMTRYGSGGYGTGQLAGGWLYTLDPFEPTATVTQQSAWDRRNMRGLQRRFPDQFPGWAMWPEPGGLLPWADTADGDVVGWRTVGTPDEWGTGFFGRGRVREPGFGAVEFIFRLLGGTLGAPELDGRFSPLAAGEELRFFPMEAGAMRHRARPREEVTVTFAGLATVVDAAALSSAAMPGRMGDPEEAIRQMDIGAVDGGHGPADEIIESWRATASSAGFFVTGVGTYRSGSGDPLHLEISGSFDPSIDADAKRLVADLAARLGTPITEVRNLEYERIWDDLAITR
jgi:hypothetical protein